MKCRHGGKIGANWSDRQCAFNEEGKFIKDNWNCALMNQLRVEDENHGEIQYKHAYSDDQNCLIIPFDNGKFAIISFYKRRGKTEGFFVMDESIIREGTESDISEILKQELI
jgi:hypothetical protein